MTAPDKNEHLDRHHTDAPAEGETEGWVPHDTGLHSQGWTRFEHTANGIESALTLFVPAADPVIFNDAFSLLVNCASQAEIDRYWEALRANGGKPQACGWIIDRYGVRWQISAAALGDMMKDPDRTKARRVAEEMLRQVKIDLARLEAAYRGG